MNRVFFLKSLGSLHHFFVLHALKFQVHSSNHHLVLFAVNLENLSLTLLVTAGNNFNLDSKIDY